MKKEHRYYQFRLRLVRAGEGGLWEGVVLNPPWKACTSAPGNPCPASHISLFQRVSPDQPNQDPCSCPTCLSLSSQLPGTGIFYEQTLIPIPSVMPCPPQTLIDFLLSCLVPHTSSSSLPCPLVTPRPAQYMNFFLAGH